MRLLMLAAATLAMTPACMAQAPPQDPAIRCMGSLLAAMAGDADDAMQASCTKLGYWLPFEAPKDTKERDRRRALHAEYVASYKINPSKMPAFDCIEDLMALRTDIFLKEAGVVRERSPAQQVLDIQRTLRVNDCNVAGRFFASAPINSVQDARAMAVFSLALAKERLAHNEAEFEALARKVLAEDGTNQRQ